MNHISPNARALHSLAEEKLELLKELQTELYAFLEKDDIQTGEIESVFEKQRDCMQAIEQNDRLYESALKSLPDPRVRTALKTAHIGGSPDLPGWAALLGTLEDQRALARRVLGLIGEAHKKAETLAEDCRNGLRGVQQRKWICSRFAGETLTPGSLLNYSETLHRPRG